MGPNPFLNSLESIAAFHIETSHLISTADQMNGFFMATYGQSKK